MITSYKSRETIKEAISSQRTLLEQHKEALAKYESAYAELGTDSELAMLDLMHEKIVRETRKVRSIENDIRTLERELKTKYSVTPEYLAM